MTNDAANFSCVGHDDRDDDHDDDDGMDHGRDGH
jgi:hypothetical protein